ncbi:MAG: DUF3857 domain-containing protein, partial [Verrucomicrobia bacterium]|nr:DUF3857 domain-containing protein [Verrucomicrobiota bacterium]
MNTPTKRHGIPRLVLGFLALWVLATPALAQVTLPHNLLDRSAALSAASAVSADQYPNSDSVLIAGLQRVAYEPDGTHVQWHEEYIKILTETGRRSHLTLSSYFTIPYQSGPEDCQIPLVEIIGADGVVRPVDVAGQSRIMINPDSMAANIYNPNEKVILVNVAGLQIGDVLHFVMYDRVVQPRMVNTWSDWYVLESSRPLVHQVIEIDAPAALPLASIALKDPVAGTVTQTVEAAGERLHYRWEARNIPRMFPEPNMPPYHTVVQRLLVSTNPDWESVSRWYWNLSVGHFDPTPELTNKVAELIAGVTDPMDQIQQLFSFVSQEIRYMGV